MYTFGEREQMTNDTARSTRLNMRISPEALEELKNAASTNSQDVTSFVLGAAMDKAREVMLEKSVISLSIHDIQQLEQALSAPVNPSKALRDLFAKTAQRVNG